MPASSARQKEGRYEQCRSGDRDAGPEPSGIAQEGRSVVLFLQRLFQRLAHGAHLDVVGLLELGRARGIAAKSAASAWVRGWPLESCRVIAKLSLVVADLEPALDRQSNKRRCEALVVEALLDDIAHARRAPCPSAVKTAAR